VLKQLKPEAGDEEQRGSALLAWYGGEGAATVFDAMGGVIFMEWLDGPTLGDAGEVTYFEPSQWTLGPRIGSFAASRFPNPGQTGNDYAWVRVDAGHTQPPIVYGWGKGDATVRGGTEAAVGTAVCRSGRTSGWRCGTIEAKNVTVNYSSGETILNLTRTTACSEGGDSGGSFITGPGQAQGVLSGGSGSCKGKQPNNRTRSYYQPLLPILSAYNLTLRTGT
jgi:streptogrisin C